MAKLYFRYGTMGSSKTANALMVKFNYQEKGQKALLLTPSVDTRFGIGKITSRIGLESDAHSVEEFISTTGKKLKCPNEYDCVIVDEAQFLTSSQVRTLASFVDEFQIPVLCYGLRTDFRGNLFEGSKTLMAYADKIEEIKTICWCGRKATFNARYNKNGIVRDGAQVELGANDKYISLCRKHFISGQLSQ